MALSRVKWALQGLRIFILFNLRWALSLVWYGFSLALFGPLGLELQAWKERSQTWDQAYQYGHNLRAELACPNYIFLGVAGNCAPGLIWVLSSQSEMRHMHMGLPKA